MGKPPADAEIVLLAAVATDMEVLSISLKVGQLCIVYLFAARPTAWPVRIHVRPRNPIWCDSLKVAMKPTLSINLSPHICNENSSACVM